MSKWYERYYELIQKCKKETKEKELDCPQNVSSSQGFNKTYLY